MSKGKVVYLAYQKDFSEKGGDRYFLYEEGKFSEIPSLQLVSLECFVVTHDFWLISNSLYKTHQKLPAKIIDVVLLSKIVSGIKSIKGDTQPWDISKTIKPLYKNSKDFDEYQNMYYRRKELELDTYMLFSHKLAEHYENLSELAYQNGEMRRFYDLELPIFNALTHAACKGIPVDSNIVQMHKKNLKLDFYRQLKSFSEKHDVLYELPNEGEIRDKLATLGYDTQNYSLDFLIDFLPSRDGYTDDLRSLQKTNKTYRIFNSIPSNSNRLRPIVESHWTSTSRIYHKAPNLQNISRKYRNIFTHDAGMSLCYVDYDQFEVGVMAAISSDPTMKHIYENADAYKDLATQVFADENRRKKAKVLFLSYAYGMSLENIMRSVREMGGNQKKANDYFLSFSTFELWKQNIHKDFLESGRIGTISGNYLHRASKNELTEKEKRTSVNHVIQGTATYIFKKALLELSMLNSVQILIPMHDAVLFQHSDHDSPAKAIDIFQNVMTEALEGKVTGKASIEPFYVE